MFGGKVIPEARRAEQYKGKEQHGKETLGQETGQDSSARFRIGCWVVLGSRGVFWKLPRHQASYPRGHRTEGVPEHIKILKYMIYPINFRHATRSRSDAVGSQQRKDHTP